MVVVRIVTGIRKHWVIRASEWVMLYPAIGLGLVLTYQEDLFQVSRSFGPLSRWADQSTWAIIVLAVAMTRLVALTVNGTFDGFRYSPHMRLIACIAGIFFWSQYFLGLTNAAYFEGGAWSGPVAYSTFVLFELLNIYRVWGDVALGRDG